MYPNMPIRPLIGRRDESSTDRDITRFPRLPNALEARYLVVVVEESLNSHIANDFPPNRPSFRSISTDGQCAIRSKLGK